jgi:glycine cleavage system H protein
MGEYKGCRIPEDLLYNLDYHAWVKIGDQIATLGITEPAQAYSGEVIFIKIKDVGTKLQKGAILATVESAKFMGPMRIPLSGTVSEVNSAVKSTPNLVNSDCYTNWVAKIKPEKIDDELKTLISAKEATERYKPIIEEWGVDCSKKT